MSVTPASCAGSRRRRPLGRAAADGLRSLDGARLPLEPARRRPRAREPRRRQHLREGDGDVDHAGREVRVLWVKGSGTDLATITAAGFAGLRLDELLPLREPGRDGRRDDGRRTCSAARSAPTSRGRRSRRCCTRSSRRRTSTTRTRTRSSRSPRRRTAGELAEEAFGDEAVWLDYQRPGFDMSRRIAELLEENPAARAVLLEKHGLVTWGETGEESYDATIEFVSRAARRDRHGSARPLRPGGPQGRGARRSGMRALLLSQALPALRGALLADTDGSCSRSTGAPRRSRSPRRRARPR